MLSELLPDTPLPVDVAVSDLTDDSRAVRAGSLFVACPGLTVDGRAFMGDAIAGGAAAIVAEAPVPSFDAPIPLIEMTDLATARGDIASRFFGHPSEGMLVVAVTGTNGKTSCSQFIARGLELAGRRAGVIGTLGFGLSGRVGEPGLTTPPAIELQRRLHLLHCDGADSVALEASSHGLAQNRLRGVKIDVAVFTNITHDHLDYHDTFAEYLAAKRRLFEWRGLQAAIINLDDPHYVEFIHAVRGDARALTFSTSDKAADVYASAVTWRPDGFDADVVTPWGSGLVSSNLLGEFNVSNLLATITVLGLLEHDIADVCRWAGEISGVPGRMDMRTRPGQPTVVIDYAHTPDALEKALGTLRRHTGGHLYCVVGCGGDRDATKRPLMGRIAADRADFAILTSDNPRGEAPGAIIEDMLSGSDQSDRVRTIEDRREAIVAALSAAGERDIVLLAGKGHEDYQEIAGKRLPFSDYAEVERYFEQVNG